MQKVYRLFALSKKDTLQTLVDWIILIAISFLVLSHWFVFKVYPAMSDNSGIPTRILHEAIGSVITVETSSGETYKGRLTKVEDNMNLEMEEVTHTYPNGKNRPIKSFYLRGSHIVFFQLPDDIKSCPAMQALIAATKAAAMESDKKHGAKRGAKKSAPPAGKGFGSRKVDSKAGGKKKN